MRVFNTKLIPREFIAKLSNDHKYAYDPSFKNRIVLFEVINDRTNIAILTAKAIIPIEREQSRTQIANNINPSLSVCGPNPRLQSDLT